jgi:hypothetical protein
MLPQNDSTVLASYLAEMLCGFSLAPLIRSFGVPRRFEADRVGRDVAQHTAGQRLRPQSFPKV